MSVNMSGIDKNPFRIGDKVKVKSNVLRTWPRAFKNFLPVKYAVVTKLDSVYVFTDVDSDPTNFEHFELYKEPEVDIMNKSKTKRIPFTKELWKRNQTAKVIWTPTETEILYFDKWGGCDYDFIGVYKAPGAEYAASTFVEGDFPSMALEIPVTTKRIPFNPELKDAKVVCKHTSDELLEWVYMMSSVVCGVIDREGSGFTTELYHPNYLEMEIEEDAP